MAALLLLGSPEDQSVVCPAGGPCPTMDYWPWALRSVFQKQIKPPGGVVALALARRFRARQEAGEVPVVVYVGPADTVEELEPLAPIWRSHRPRLVLVEPNKLLLPRLSQTLQDAGLNFSRVDVVNTALCPSDSDSKPLYTLSQRLLQDFPRLDSTFHESFSLSKEVLVTSHLRDFDSKNRAGYSREEWDSMLAYIEELSVRCATPVALLRELGLRPGDVDALFVDAEGYDSELVELFLSLQGFSPAYLSWEWWLWSTSFDASGNDVFAESIAPLASPMSKLASRGHAVYQSGNNLIALDVRP